MSDFKFSATITEIYDIDILIEAETESEAREIIRSRDFDFTESLDYGDCLGSEFTNIKLISEKKD